MGIEDSIPDLLTDELSSAGIVLPLAEEELAEERVQRLLLVAILFAAAGVLLLQCAEEPLENEQGALGRVGLFGRRSEDIGMFTPV